MAAASGRQADERAEFSAADKAKLGDQLWRLNNLYWITDKAGQRVKFKMNWAQQLLYRNMWYLNVVLKARQLGMSTFILLYILDTCLFNSNVRAGVIAHSKEDAQVLFRDKIKYAYDNLPDDLKQARSADTRTAGEILFSNNSSIRVATSVRSGTLQILHVSEFGKICRKYPDKAREIVTGSFEAVHPGQMIFVESTAEGREGRFFDMCQEAKALADARKDLGQLDYRFHFYPWWKHPDNVLDPTNILLYPPLKKYFEELQAKYGIRLTNGQKAWYAAKSKTLGDDIKREHPSTPEEAFEVTIEGAYFGQQITKARQERRICSVPHQDGYTVDTWWDLGINDTCVIWFTQTIGMEIRVIDYYANSGEGLQHYVDLLRDKGEKLGYRYGEHVWPHDGGHLEFGTGKTRQDQAADMGLRVSVLPRGDLQDGIEATRNFLSICWFDEEKTDEGLTALEAYRKDWDEKLGTWKRTPLHDWASHPADGFRTLAIGHKERMTVRKSRAAKPVTPRSQQVRSAHT